jgi:hypothetical protein
VQCNLYCKDKSARCISTSCPGVVIQMTHALVVIQ